MNYKGHIVGGIVTFAVLIYFLKFFQYPLDMLHNIQWFLFCILGALFPDVDTKSKIQIWLYRLFFVIYLLLLILNPQPNLLIFISILALIPLIVHHRGMFHKLYFLTGLPLCILGIIYITKPHLFIESSFFALFFIAGALSHLLLDKMKNY
jgi:hypothetical protein